MYVGFRKNAEKLSWLAEVPWSFLGSYLAKKKNAVIRFLLSFCDFDFGCSSFETLLWLIRRDSTIRAINAAEGPEKYHNFNQREASCQIARTKPQQRCSRHHYLLHMFRPLYQWSV